MTGHGDAITSVGHYKCETGGWRNRSIADKVRERDTARGKLFKIVSVSFEYEISARQQGFCDCMFSETERVELYQQKLRPTEMCDQLPTGKRAGIAPIALRRRIIIDVVEAGRTEKRGYITVTW